MLEEIGNYTAEFFVNLFCNMLLGLAFIGRNITGFFLPAIWIYAIVAYYAIEDKKAYHLAIKTLFIYIALLVIESVLI